MTRSASRRTQEAASAVAVTRLLGRSRGAGLGGNDLLGTGLMGEAKIRRDRGLFEEVPPIDAKNVGLIQGWRTTHRALETARGHA
jgi:hypothetical protein